MRVSQDTYIRNDGLAGQQNDDPDNELLVGRADLLRPLLDFDVSDITDAVTSTGGGNYDNLTIQSATLTIYERRAPSATIGTIDVRSYDFDFSESTPIWNNPAGNGSDTTPGGTLGTLLADDFSINWPTSGTDNDSSVIALDAAGLKAAIQNASATASLGLILTSNGYSNVSSVGFHSVTSNRSVTTTRHALLEVNYTVAGGPPPNPVLLLAATSPHTDFTFSSVEQNATQSQRTLRYEIAATDGATVTIEALGLTGAPGHPNGGFSVSSVPAVPVTLGNGQTIDITVTVDSGTVGAFAGSLFVDTSAAGGSVAADRWDITLPLSSSITAPRIAISGVYPHLAVTSDYLEVGIGAVVPWADRLWAITYGPHIPTGDTTNKLYEIDAQLNRTTRPESLGGTPANRFIHEPSNQLIIGPHFIDANRNIRNLPYTSAPGRHTSTAAHLTDPTNRVYIFTMEDGLYDVNVNDLSFITRYPDVQGTGDKFLFGYHGKGAFTGQGNLIVANNGRPKDQENPLGSSGALARWNGTTYADNGNQYFPLPAINNNSSLENTNGPATGQAQFMAGWTQDFTVQHCEVSGPGGIKGNANPATDPVWATGFDAKSVVLRVLENGNWTTWRLPKASYTHDGSHGWHTEWPRIRQLDPSTPGSPYLMHMHGLFFDFPPSFSTADFSGLTPLCNYYKMPVDYCTFEGQLVIAKNDASKFENSLALRAQSNFWFGQLSDFQEWGAPSGHGAVWMNEAVTAGQTSEPFLINGFSQRTLHLRNLGDGAVSVEIQTSSGNGTWASATTINVPANSYTHQVVNSLPGEWVRLIAGSANSSLTAFFHMANPYPHAPVASVGTDRFAALADIRDTSGYSDGIIRAMAGAELELEFASDNGYHRIGANMLLTDTNNPTAETSLRAQGALTKEFGNDAASAWIEVSGVRYRVPMLDPLYNAPFLSGWARGEREVVTERKLFNLHGTFYEVPRDNSGGKRRMRALATHGKRITDFASWRGLLVFTGVLDDAPASSSLVRSPSGAALWLGEADDLWKMGEPRGTGGPWNNSAVTANQPSDIYLMDGYDHKELSLSHSSASDVTFTVQVDFLADNTWSTYSTFTVAPGQTLNHVFPAGFHAHWARVVSNTSATATAQFTYGPANQRDAFLDWGRDEGLPTGSGRAALANGNGDGDDLNDLLEFIFGTDPSTPNSWPHATTADAMTTTLRDLGSAEGITVEFQSCIDLKSWIARPDLVTLASDQSGVPEDFTRWSFTFDPATDPKRFVRISANP